MLIKVCGITDAENLREVEAAGADLVGFIFYPKSPRCVPPGFIPPPRKRQPSTTIPLSANFSSPIELQGAKRVGVFVNAEQEFILEKTELFGLDYVQLHGDESVSLCKSLKDNGLAVIKAFQAAWDTDLTELTRPYVDYCELFLFDTPCSGFGGSGQTYDWSILASYRGPRLFLLSGGLNPSSMDDLKNFSHPYCIGLDLNSGFEPAPGLKNARAIADFIRRLDKVP